MPPTPLFFSGFFAVYPEETDFLPADPDGKKAMNIGLFVFIRNNLEFAVLKWYIFAFCGEPFVSRHRLQVPGVKFSSPGYWSVPVVFFVGAQE